MYSMLAFEIENSQSPPASRAQKTYGPALLELLTLLITGTYSVDHSIEEKSLGCPPSTFDVFVYTHTKDHVGKTFIVDKAKQVHDKFKSRRDELVALGEEVDDRDLFYRRT